jgi:ABC-type transporter Mla MlaB component
MLARSHPSRFDVYKCWGNRDFLGDSACPIAWYGHCGRSVGNRTAAMLRISAEAGLQRVTLRLEGRLTGIWVKELEDAWREAESTRNGRPLFLDCSAVDHVDQAGEYLLALAAWRGVQLTASGIAMRELCRKIAAGWPHTAATGE